MVTQQKPPASPAAGALGAASARKPRGFLTSSVGTKMLLGSTGLLLIAYLVLHLAGNLIFYFGPDLYNGWSHALISNPLIYPVEIGLAAIFIIHIYKAVTNYLANRCARPVAYYKRSWGGPGSRKSWASSTMLWSGLITLVFVGVHLRQFKFGAEYHVEGAAGVMMRDLHRLELEVFSNPFNVAFYMFCMIVVGSHLWHGFSSAFQSLGADHPRFTPLILVLGKALAIIIGAGFFFIPIWAYYTVSTAGVRP